MNVELRRQADHLLEKIGAFETYYNKYALIYSASFHPIILGELQEIKFALEHKYKREIEDLPDTLPEVDEDKAAQEARGKVEEKIAVITRQFNRYNQIYDRLANQVGAIIADLEGTRYILLQEKYNRLIRTENYVIPDYEVRYERDAAFSMHLAALRTHIAAYSGLVGKINASIRDSSKEITAAGISAKEKAYNEGIEALQVYDAQYRLLLKTLKQKMNSLQQAEISYVRATYAKNVFLQKSTALRSIPAEELESLHKVNYSLAIKIRGFQEPIAKLATLYPEDPIAFLDAGNNYEQMIVATRRINEDVIGFNEVHDSLLAEVIAFPTLLESKINENQQAFMHVYDEIHAALEQHGLDTVEITKIKVAFDTIISLADDVHSDPISFLHHKNEKIKTILAKLIQQELKEQERITNKLHQKIELLMDTLIAQRKAILHGVRITAFDFNSEEAALYAKVIAFPYARNKFTPGVTYETLLEQQSNLQKEGDALKKIITVHRHAKQIFTNNLNLSLINEINHPERGPIIFAALAQYLPGLTESVRIDFFTKFSHNLHLFNPQGLNAIRPLINARPPKEVRLIKDKLTFIDLLAKRNIPYHSFLGKPEAIAAALHLHALRLDKFISSKSLNNPDFCKALAILEKYGMEDLLSLNKNRKSLSNNIQVLLDDPAKCAVVCQQEKLYREAKGPSRIQLDVFKALLCDFIKADKSVAQVVDAIRVRAPKYCGHWLLVMVKENALLRSLLSNQENIDKNMPFIIPLLERSLYSPHLNFNFLGDYLSSKPAIQKLGQADFQSYMADYQEAFLAVRKANESNDELARHSLQKMAAFMTQFNTWMTTYKEELAQQSKTKKAVSDFHVRMIPTLLAVKPTEAKRKDLEKLTREHFKGDNGFINACRDILQFILTLLRSTFNNRPGFFTWEKTPMQRDVDTGAATAFEAVADLCTPRGSGAAVDDIEFEAKSLGYH